MNAQRPKSRPGWRQRSLVPWIAVTAMAMAAVPQAADATTVEKLGARELVAKSPVVVHATAVASESRWNADRTLVVTETRLRVHTALKGDVSGEVSVLQPGGTVGKLRVEVPGVAPFVPGEEAVLFLAENPAGERFVQGASQGRFDVAVDRFSGRKVVRGALLGELMQVESQPGKAGAAQDVDLDVFLARVRDRIRGIEDPEVGR